MSFSKPVWIGANVLGLVTLMPFAIAQERPATPDAKQEALLKMAKEIRKEIVTQPCTAFSTRSISGSKAARSFCAGKPPARL